MIKNMFTRRKESETYLATVSRYRWSRQIMMKATVLVESYNILSIFIMIYLLQRCLLTVAM